MLLTGSFERSVDDKQRVAIPKKWRDQLGGSTLYVAPGTDGSLAVYAEESFSRLGNQLEGSSPTGQDVRDFSRMFYAQAESVDVDGQGRVRVPAGLAKLAALEREVTLIGVRDHVEIWNRGRWEQYLSDRQSRYDQIAENAFQAKQT